jgi:SAM-dependent methyltransferase
MKFLFTFGISLSAFLSGLSQAEGYLHAWHSRHADASRVFIEARDPDGRSSYERLATLASPGACVLDVACGTGALLARVGATVSSTQLVGVDFCQSELRLARGRLPGVALYAARAQALPLTDAAFDLVVCHMALMLMDNPEARPGRESESTAPRRNVQRHYESAGGPRRNRKDDSRCASISMEGG